MKSVPPWAILYECALEVLHVNRDFDPLSQNLLERTEDGVLTYRVWRHFRIIAEQQAKLML